MDSLKFELPEKYLVVIFDLDDTLYDEREYLFSGYRNIGVYIQKSVGGNAVLYSRFLIETFLSEGRHKLFDKFLANFELKNVVKIENLLFLLRHNQILLNVRSCIQVFLRELLAKKRKVYILTNGNVEQQQNKIRQLNIQDILPQIEVMYANMYTPKPSPDCIKRILMIENVTRDRVVLIGDSDVDMMTAKNAGIDFIHVNKIENNGFA